MATFDVLLPVRNGLPFLAEAVDSIRAQTFPDWRLLVLDHGSSDGSLSLAQKYEDEDLRIKVFSLPHADGLADLLNAGLEKCDCKYMLRQDADDISLINRMSVVESLFNNNPNFFAIGGDVFMIDAAGRQVGHLQMPTSPDAITAAGFFYNPMLHPTIAANFSALKRCGAAYGKNILNSVSAADSLTVKGLAEDYVLFGQLALLGPCANAGIPLINYRRHEASVGIANSFVQIELSLQISRFLAKSFCAMKGLPEFDPGPFCNHGEYVFDLRAGNYADQFERMVAALRRGLGQSTELERELAFRRVLATRNSAQMAARYLQFRLNYKATPSEWRTVRNWFLRGVRKGKYVYRGGKIQARRNA